MLRTCVQPPAGLRRQLSIHEELEALSSLADAASRRRGSEDVYQWKTRARAAAAMHSTAGVMVGQFVCWHSREGHSPGTPSLPPTSGSVVTPNRCHSPSPAD